MSLVLLLAVACGGGDDDDDDAPDAGLTQTLPVCEDTEPAGAVSLAPVASTLAGTIELPFARQSPPGDLNPATEAGELAYFDLGYADYTRGTGQARLQRTDLGGATDFGERRSLAYFVHLTDPQLVDDESPVRWGNLDNTNFGGALRPQEAYVARTLSAMNRTLARIESLGRDFDFGIVTGDCMDNAHWNELRWFLDVMDGANRVHVDSGDDDDPVPGPDNDPKDPFDAVAFPAPYYFVFGNHDLHVIGVELASGYAGLEVDGFSTLGTRDYTQWYAPVVTGEVPADPDRRFVDRDDVIAELHNTAANAGHGFAAEGDTSLGANYEVDVIPGLLRLIQLDTNDDTGGSRGMVKRDRFDGFLVPALQRAESDGVLAIVTSHHPSDEIDTMSGELGDPVADAVDGDEIAATIASYPNVIMALVGHTHDNRVAAIAGADAAHPGYWEVMTSALSDWPVQTRIVEIVDNGNGTLSIMGTLVDYDETSCLERRHRRLAAIDYVAGWSDPIDGDPMHENVELVIPVPASAAAAVAAAAATAPAKIESDTTLAQ